MSDTTIVAFLFTLPHEQCDTQLNSRFSKKVHIKQFHLNITGAKSSAASVAADTCHLVAEH